MEDLDHETREELPSRSTGVEDAGEVSGRVLLRLQRILVSTRIRRVRVPTRRFGVLLAHELTTVEIHEAGDIPHRPTKINNEMIELQSPWCPDHEISPLQADRGDCPLDLFVEFLRLFSSLLQSR